MNYHLFWKSTHYICENCYSAIKLRNTLRGGLIISDNAPCLNDYVKAYRGMLY